MALVRPAFGSVLDRQLWVNRIRGLHIVQPSTSPGACEPSDNCVSCSDAQSSVCLQLRCAKAGPLLFAADDRLVSATLNGHALDVPAEQGYWELSEISVPAALQETVAQSCLWLG
jgi:hypothetical protein